MSNSRRIAVFYKSDGRCIHDDLDEESSRRTSEKRPENNIAATALWPLIQVFMQFSREVQGGAIKRLVFRNPADYAPPAQCFEPAPPSGEPGSPPIVVHIAHDDLFVVAVTEMLADGSNASRLGAVKDGATSGVTITNFCTSLLDFLRGEQTKFLRSAKESEEAERANRQVDRETNPMEDSGTEHLSSASASLSGSGSLSGSEGLSRNAVPAMPSLDPVVSIDVARLTQHIAQNQNLLRL